MVLARPAAAEVRRPLLLVLVFGVVLVLVGVTASALVAVTSAHMRASTLNTVAARDASLVGLFVNSRLQPADLDRDGSDAARVDALSDQLRSLGEGGEIVRIEVRDLSNHVLFSDASTLGSRAGDSVAMDSARSGTATVALLEEGDTAAAAGPIASTAMLEEFFPILDEGGSVVAVVALWRDARELMERLASSGRDVMVVALIGGGLLAALLFFLFRASQRRLDGQHDLLVEATRTDALTGLLSHGAAVAQLSEEIERARRANASVGIAIIDLDGFRRLNQEQGHDAADEALIRAALAIRSVAPDAVAGRYGPDEFLTVRTGADGPSTLSLVGDVLARLDGVTVSAGISGFPEHAQSVTELLSTAARALGEAKAAGGNRACVARVTPSGHATVGSLEVLEGLVAAVDSKDRYTRRHSEDVARYAELLASHLGMDEGTRRAMRMAGLLHDVGKIGIPDAVLRNSGPLTEDEFRTFQQHATLGDAIVRDIPNLDLVRSAIRHHHERWDGAGYPEGLSEEAIPVAARIVAVADAFSAMTTARGHQRAVSRSVALRRLRRGAGSQFQAELVTEFIAAIDAESAVPKTGEESPHASTAQLWVA